MRVSGSVRKIRTTFVLMSVILTGLCSAASASAANLPRFKPNVPPLIVPAPAGPLAILGAADIDRYTRIFDFQKRGNMKAANLQIAELDDEILMGHVLFQRYLHPTAWRSSYSELFGWMALYNDHPAASRVYNLAERRRPSGASKPKRHQLRKWRRAPLDPGQAANPPRRQSFSKRRQVTRIKVHVRSLLRRERPTQALNYINSTKTQRSLTTHEYDQMRQWVANSYYLENVDKKALRVAAAVAKSSGRNVPLAYWTAGLASWRLGKMEDAAHYFTKMARAKNVSHESRSAGAYWASRARLATRDPLRSVEMLELAASNPTTFYGLLAGRQLGHDPVEIGAVLTIDQDALKTTGELSDGPARSATLALKRPGVTRAVALAQIGQIALAEDEMRRAHGKSKKADDEGLFLLARHWHLPAAQLEIANHSSDPAFLVGRYPVPAFQPDDGFKIDPALLFAFIRQESKFNTQATSRVGARGLMQLMPNTAVHVAKDRSLRHGNKDRLYDPSFNMMLGQKYIQELMTAYKLKDNLFELLIAYNGGPGNLRKWKKNTVYHDDPLLFIESIPSRETRGFLEAVSRNLWMYRMTLGQETPSLDLLAAGNWPGYIAVEVLPEPTDSFVLAPSTIAN